MHLPLVPALILTAVAMTALHWFPLFHPRKLHRIAAYAIGVATVGAFLSWHQYSFGSDWRLFWLFFGVAGAVVGASWGLDYALAWWIARDADVSPDPVKVQEGLQAGRDTWKVVP